MLILIQVKSLEDLDLPWMIYEIKNIFFLYFHF